jgi:inosine-uridine nucleoside N-ribohydrolase
MSHAFERLSLLSFFFLGRQQSGRKPNCRVAKQVDLPAFWQLMADALAKADSRSPLNF